MDTLRTHCCMWLDGKVLAVPPCFAPRETSGLLRSSGRFGETYPHYSQAGPGGEARIDEEPFHSSNAVCMESGSRRL